MTKRIVKATRGHRQANGSKPKTRRSPQKEGAPTKTATCLDLLRRAEGTTISDLQKATGWQPHSVRGFLAGTINKMPGVTLTSEKREGQARRYRVHGLTK